MLGWGRCREVAALRFLEVRVGSKKQPQGAESEHLKHGREARLAILKRLSAGNAAPATAYPLAPPIPPREVLALTQALEKLEALIVVWEK